MSTTSQTTWSPPNGFISGGLTELSGAGAPTDGVTGANVAGIGSRYTDTTNGIQYMASSTGSLAAPKWVAQIQGENQS